MGCPGPSDRLNPVDARKILGEGEIAQHGAGAACSRTLRRAHLFFGPDSARCGRGATLLLVAFLAGCSFAKDAAVSAVPGGALAAKAIGGGGAKGAPPSDAPLVAGDLSIVQHPGSGPLVAATRIDGDLTVEHVSGAGDVPATPEEVAAAQERQEVEVLQRLLEERIGEDSDGS